MRPPDPEPTRHLSVDEALALLRTGELVAHEVMPWSSNYTFLAEVNHGAESALVIYKPRRGERPLWDFPSGTLFQREVAAFLLSEALGWQLVPPTVVREGEHGIGMVQLYIHHDPEEHFFTFREPWRDELTRIALFDVLINNADRKGGHCLRDEQDRIWAIDHGVCFHEEPKLRTVIWELAGQPIPDPLLEDLRSLGPALAPDAPLATSLSPLLAPGEIDALRARRVALLARGRFPNPRPGYRHTPWPMV